jgi:hypothetical protein
MNIFFAIAFACGGLTLAVLLGLFLYKDTQDMYFSDRASEIQQEHIETA